MLLNCTLLSIHQANIIRIVIVGSGLKLLERVTMQKTGLSPLIYYIMLINIFRAIVYKS